MVVLLFFAFWTFHLFYSSLALWSSWSAKACLLRYSSPLPASLLKTKSLRIRDNKITSPSYMFIWYPRPGDVKTCPAVVIFVSDNLPQQFFCLFFLVFRNTKIPVSWWMPGNGRQLCLYFCFLGHAFLIAFVPPNNLMIVTVVIIIVPWFYLLLRYKSISDIFQQPWSHAHRLIANFLF